jgi:hypothetical protein
VRRSDQSQKQENRQETKIKHFFARHAVTLMNY